jgi:BirA family biotin operon repressor/biotin-[acetyl-CoA-carboxylase] ligase
VTAFGAPHLHLRRTESTNDRARELAAAGAPSGTVVTASEQSAGRGRRGRIWSAPANRALLYSAVLRPLELTHGLLPLSVPVAVCEAVEAVGDGLDAKIKWPNDVWIREAKVAGVLIEARPPEWAVIGIGVNVAIRPGDFPSELRWPATSIGDEATVAATRDAVSAALARWVEAPEAEVLAEFRARDALAGREVGWEGAGIDPGAGTAAGVDERGNLVVERADGERISLGSGEVSLRLAPQG